jgi:hypothetical protein
MISPVYLVANLNSIKLATNGTQKTEVYVINRTFVIDRAFVIERMRVIDKECLMDKRWVSPISLHHKHQ